jgi:arabinose-5-phosphate isomerase
MKNLKEIALKTIELEAESVKQLQNYIDADFIKSVHLIHKSKGRLIISGIGKSAIIAQKIVSTLNSTGTPSLFLHAADAIHGDLGMVQKDDVVMIVSKSGESPEIKILATLIKNFNNKLIALVGNVSSFLALKSDFIINSTVTKEACPNNLAPTSSTTAQLVMGDALAVCLMNLNGFKGSDFAKFHPGGALGKKMYLRVKDLYESHNKPFVYLQSELKDIIIEITKKRLGVTAVIDKKGILLGIITDGDLRRMLENTTNLKGITAKTIYTQNPKTIDADKLAIDALDILRSNNISQLVVVDKKNKYLGILHLHEIIKEGIV